MPNPSQRGEPNGGLLVLPDPFLRPRRELIFNLATRLQLPAVYGGNGFDNGNGLIHYGVEDTDFARQIALYVDRMTLQDVSALRDAMLRFYSQVKEGFRIGQNESAIRKSLDLSNWENLERSYVIGRNINRAYLEIETDSFNE